MQNEQSQQPIITFERVERVCKWNEERREVAAKTLQPALGIIYDFKVLIDGEFRAILDRQEGRKYVLTDVDGGEIYRPGGRQVPVIVLRQSAFETAIRAKLDWIPTLAQYQEERDKTAALVAEGEAIRRKQDQAEPALKLLQRYMDAIGHEPDLLALSVCNPAPLALLWEESNQVLIAAGL